MKKLVYCLFLLWSLPNAGNGQILNAGFENWTNGDPDDWMTSNIVGQVTNVSSNTDAHSGAASARGEVVSFSGTNYQPFLTNTTTAYAGSGIDHRVISLTFWLKFHSVSADALKVTTSLTKNATTQVGASFVAISNEVSDWTQLILPFTYFDKTTIPDTMTVAFTIAGAGGASPHTGSWFELDDIAYNDVSDGVRIPSSPSLAVNVYPNPAQERSSITLSLSEYTFVNISIYDVSGRNIRQLAMGPYPAGDHIIAFQREGLAAGMYYLRVSAGEQSVSAPLIIGD